MAGPNPLAAAMLSGTVKPRLGRKAVGPMMKAPTQIKKAPAKPGLLPGKPAGPAGLF